MNLQGWLVSKILLYQGLRQGSTSLLNNSLLTKNPVYRYIYTKRMSRIMREREEKAPLLTIENTNACNLRCRICPHDKMRREVGFMDMDLFRKIIDECYPLGVDHITISGFGEPLLDRRFAERVAYAKEKGIKHVSSVTNGILLNSQLARALIEAGLDEIQISIDAAKAETYEIMRPPGKLEVVEKNILNLRKLRDSRGALKPKIVVKLQKTQENRGEIELFKKKWKRIADVIYIGFFHNWGGSLERDPFELHGLFKRAEPCPMLWGGMVIQWDGRVPMCCLDCEGEAIIGNAKREKLEDIRKGEALRSIRKAHLNLEFQKIPICAKCDLWTSWWLYY